MDPTQVVQTAVDLAAQNPKAAAILAAIPVMQMSLGILAYVPRLWGGNTGDTGAGSGWSRWCRKLAALPIRVPGVK